MCQNIQMLTWAIGSYNPLKGKNWNYLFFHSSLTENVWVYKATSKYNGFFHYFLVK